MSSFVELPQSCMGFQLKSGETIFIHKEDCHKIALALLAENVVNKTNIVFREKDLSIEKANILFDVLKLEKDMDGTTRKKYLLQIERLLSGSEKVLIDLATGKEATELPDEIK